jgi:hypothetical protein
VSGVTFQYFIYDGLNRMRTGSENVGSTETSSIQLVFDSLSRLIDEGKWFYFSGFNVWCHITHDKWTIPSCSTTSLVGFTTQYDPSSNKLYERALNAESRSALYPSYDSMDRLLEYQRGVLASAGGNVTTPITLPGTDSDRVYNLDGLGNWSTTVYTPEGGSSTTETRTHNKLNEVLSFGVLPASTSVLYDHGNNAGGSYPSRGNGNIANDGQETYEYDAFNRLVRVKKISPNELVAFISYDVLGRRVGMGVRENDR